MSYVIKYEYDNYEEGCGCCSYSEQTLTVYDQNNNIVFETEYPGVWAEDEEELRFYIHTNYPEYNNFVVHEDTRWF